MKRTLFLAFLLLCVSFPSMAHNPNAPIRYETGELPFPIPATADSQAYTPEQLVSLATALRALGMTEADLGFEKKVMTNKWLLPVVADLMDHPLHNPVYALEFRNLWDQNPGLSDRLKLAFRQIDWDAKEPAPDTPASSEPSSQAEWHQLLGRLACEKPDEAYAGISRLPAPVQKSLGTALAAILNAERDFQAAFGKLSPEQMIDLKSWGVLFALETETGNLSHDRLHPIVTRIGSKEFQSQQISDFIELCDLVDWHTVARACILSAEAFDSIRASLYAVEAVGVAPAWVSSQDLSGPGLLLDIPTRFGRLAVGSTSNDVYSRESDFAVLIELGGDDIYRDTPCSVSTGWPDRPAVFFFDMSGNDIHQSLSGDLDLSAALCGASFFLDREGQDQYRSLSFSQCATAFGSAVFEDSSGRDYYQGDRFVQGAAVFGVAIFMDGTSPADSMKIELENDIYRASLFAQAFSRTQGIAVLDDQAGNDVYAAGGGVMHEPLYSDRYQSLSQGFSLGLRPDAGGGLAFLMDRSGNDRYMGEVYGQGAGYWYSAGFLLDSAGNDDYQLTIYGQGAGIHLACGTLIDESGNDGYYMNDGLGQGGSHDYAVGILMDQGGNDCYMARSASNQGTGLTNAVGILFDRSGDDTYAAHDGYATGGGRPARGFGSIGLFIDTGGKDRYTLQGWDDGIWTSREYGAGVDTASHDETPSGILPPADEPVDEPKEKFPEPGNGVRLTQEEFDRMWAVASEWAVGSNRERVPEGRRAIAAWGDQALPFIEEKIGEGEGLEREALTGIIKEMLPEHRSSITRMLNRLLKSKKKPKIITSLLLAESGALKDVRPNVLSLLEDREYVRYAVSTSGKLQFREAIPRILELVETGTDQEIMTAAVALADLKAEDSIGRLVDRLDHPSVIVRMSLIDVIPRFGIIAAGNLAALAVDGKRSERSRLNALTALSLMDQESRLSASSRVVICLDDPSWVIRASGTAFLLTLPDDQPSRSALARLAIRESHPAVRYLLRGM